MSELLPCPFCGSHDVTVVSFGPHAHSDYESDAFVKCDRCGASGPEVREPVPLGEAEDMALAAWNRRCATALRDGRPWAVERACRNRVIEINRRTPLEYRTDNFLCSACGEHFFADNECINHPIDWAFCPNCGARVVK